ncbi:MAG TPA: heme exporter protein CcmB [candidate division Zixibacteria bacterium]|nr:heme exporter protein CcmB [candidate division Zixibacteria bacterium]
MPSRRANLVSRALAVLAKDIRLELRNRYALNAILMFGITTLTVVSFALGQSGLKPSVLGALYWIVLFFSAMSGLAHVFIREEEAGTALLLRLKGDPDPVFLGKLMFNVLLLTLMTIVVTPIFFAFTDTPSDNIGEFTVLIVLGLIGLSGATTLVAAIIARASSRGALFAVLSFPVLMPLLLVLVKASQKVLIGSGLGNILTEIQFLIAYAVIMSVGSFLLFKFVWRD